LIEEDETVDMPEKPSLNDTDPSPSLAEFESWPLERVGPLVRDRTVIFSPGGSSRWYFLEHGEASVGYDQTEQFRDYSLHTLDRILELVNMMFADGIQTVLVIGATPKQIDRTAEYKKNLAWAFELLVKEDAQILYEQYQMGVLFRGGWQRMFERLGTTHLLEHYYELERQTALQRERWLIWVTEDDPIPRSLVPLIIETFETTGQVPDRATLCQAYYGRPLEHADIFISNNKPTVEGQLPPLLTVGDLYFTVNLCFHLDRPQWRGILYDHLFARRGHYRDYTAMAPGALEELRAFYKANQGVTLGVGMHHAPSRTWRPKVPPSLRPDQSTQDATSG
jgi:hypothetical protein